jgi:hypothetical protein
MSSAVRQNTLPSSPTSNLFPLTPEQYTDKDEEYVPLLTSRHLINDLESDIAEDEEEDTRSVHKGRRRLAKVVQLPPPPNFDHFVHPRPLHRAFINLPPNYEDDVQGKRAPMQQKYVLPMNLFPFF